MSDAVKALGGAHFDTGIAQVTELPPTGMITLRGDLTASSFAKAIQKAAGVAIPGPREARIDGAQGLMWMSPDELLLLCSYDAVPDMLASLQDGFGDAHAMAVNVSDARALFSVEGAAAREVLAKLCPVDLAPHAFGSGSFRRTRLAQVPAALWMPDEDVFRVVCFRSVARYVFDVLSVAAQPGSEVGYFRRDG
ncbi:sarcosine oxidase subunit gamma family protein [Sulfitobacter sp. D35]|uniref:sarcosine oxidase subunit gamma n=1 Tax=Sulfitobacter sp. D35 TaxID=3083252 RepID=UPI00296E6B59|nr:sarcosine oxidase subunit gamma family protein [Sulfitobacter sp. D35]MDW4497040.1 sarcosine oxidase subunit gamma family protein [Sulfitobacter sp. D35]